MTPTRSKKLHIKLSTNQTLFGHTDIVWASNIDTRRPKEGFSVFLIDNLVYWFYKKWPVAALSSTELEYCALAIMEQLLQELIVQISHTGVLWWDNMSASSLASNPFFFLENKKKKVRYVLTSNQITNIMTKVLSTSIFIHWRFKINMFTTPLSLRGDVTNKWDIYNVI